MTRCEMRFPWFGFWLMVAAIVALALIPGCIGGYKSNVSIYCTNCTSHVDAVTDVPITVSNLTTKLY